ncbi:MAG: rubrerythrin [Planctomycetes bacterium]|nr:rubrerythrin [Planctomycetota bacterium]
MASEHDDPQAPDLKESRTFENLKAAFAADAQALGRCAFFASRADIEGHDEVGHVFRSAARAGETVLLGHLEFLRAVADPQTGLPIGGSEQNLLSAIERETYAAEILFAGFARTAREEGFDQVAEWFATLSRAGQARARCLQRALDALRAETYVGEEPRANRR